MTPAVYWRDYNPVVSSFVLHLSTLLDLSASLCGNAHYVIPVCQYPHHGVFVQGIVIADVRTAVSMTYAALETILDNARNGVLEFPRFGRHLVWSDNAPRGEQCQNQIRNLVVPAVVSAMNTRLKWSSKSEPVTSRLVWFVKTLGCAKMGAEITG